jgi:alpha-beta hydrolase superfamily lysophospholipase
MKITRNITFWIIVLLNSLGSNAQEFEGSWTGEIQGMPLVFEISNTDDVFKAKMQSPSQSKTFLPMDTATIEGSKITLVLNAYKIKYEGELKGGKIIGAFTQGGFAAEMNLEKKDYVEVKPNRPQEPKAPFPYKVEEVLFANPKANNIKLAGTLTLPSEAKSPPVAILISGSGPQDRNEELLGHKPFLVLADYLTRNGIAVLRYDDRGVAASEGIQKDVTSADFATDVEAAVNYLKTRKDINKKQIGLIGHSEGGLIAPVVIANNKKDVAFFVSLAGPGLRGDQVLLPQMRKGAELQGAPEKELNFEMNLMDQLFQKVLASKNATNQALQKELKIMMTAAATKAPDALQSKYSEENITEVSKQFSGNWMRFFLTYDPAINLEKVSCPVLAINGSLDYQVIPEINLSGMKSAFAKAGNKDVTLKTLPGLNHLFQNAITGSGVEYGQIEETFDPETLQLIASWINKRFN